jgi:hypothetical protein
VLQNWVRDYIKSGNGAGGTVDSLDSSWCCEETPEIKLWISVLLRAIRDCRGEVFPCSRHERHYAQRRAQAWILSTSEAEGSFLWICRHLDMDRPTIVRMQTVSATSIPKEHNPEKNGFMVGRHSFSAIAESECPQ